MNVKVKEVEVTVNPIDANNVIGHKKENVKKLKEYYDVDLVLKQDESIKQGKSKIQVTKTFKDFAYEEKEEEAKKTVSIKISRIKGNRKKKSKKFFFRNETKIRKLRLH